MLTMGCKSGSRSLLRLAALITLTEVAICIAISALLYVQMAPTPKTIDDTDTTTETATTTTTVAPETTSNPPENDLNTFESEFLKFFTIVNKDAKKYLSEEATKIVYGTYVVLESLWVLAIFLLLGVSFKTDLYNGSHRSLLPWIIITAFICLGDVAAVCYYFAKVIYATDGQEILKQLEIAEFMTIIFLPLFFAKGVLFWIVNVVLLVKLIQSFTYLKNASIRRRQMDIEELRDGYENIKDGNFHSLDKLKMEDYPPVKGYDNRGFDKDLPAEETRFNKPNRNFSFANGFTSNEKTANNVNHIKSPPPSYYKQVLPTKPTADDFGRRRFDDNFSFLDNRGESEKRYKDPSIAVVSKTTQPPPHPNFSHKFNAQDPPSVPQKSRQHQSDNRATDSVHPYKASNFEPRNGIKHPFSSDDPGFDNPNVNPPFQPKSVLKKPKPELLQDPRQLPHINPATVPDNKYVIPRARLI